MKITISQSALYKALEIVSRVSTKHVTLPVLQCVLLVVEKEMVTLRATNLEISLELTLEATVEGTGIIAVPAQTLLQSIQFLDEKTVTLHIDDQILVIEGQRTKTSIKSIPHTEFPTINKLNSASVTIQAELFAFGIKTTAFAASQTSIKPELGSIFIQQKREHTLSFVATDSFRLIEKTVSQKGVVLSQSILLPQRNALEIARICELVGGSPELLVNENQCALAFPSGVYVTSRLVVGSFPDYEQIIPKEYVTTVLLLKDDLQKALKKTNTFLNKFLQVGVTLGEHTVTVFATNSDVGQTTDTFKAEVTGAKLALSFNQQYLVDPLPYLIDDSLTLRFAGVGRPLVIVGNNDSTVRYLVMPMNK
jgi:DNA polymerase-3 subunit beta